MPNKKRSSEDIADKALARAKALKEVSEQNVRKQLMESFAPQLKKMISQQILEMDDDELDMEDLNEEEDDIDPEDLEDLENALDEGDDEDGDGHVEVPTDEVPVEDEPVEDEELEEGADDYDELEEESDEDFLAELQSILEEDDVDVDDEDMESMDETSDEDYEELNEVEGKKNGDTYDQDAPNPTDVEKFESADGGSYTEDGKEKGDHTEKFEALVKENKKLRRALSEINNSLNETVLDEYKTQKFKGIVNGRKLTETAKLKVMRAIDEGKSEKEVDRITSVFESTLPKSSKTSKKRAIKESKGGRNSSIRKPKGKSKKMNESTSGNSGNGFEWANRLAHLSGIEKN